MSKTHELGMQEFPCIVLTPSEVATLNRAASILDQLRALTGGEDDTADTELGRADAALTLLVREIDHVGRLVP